MKDIVLQFGKTNAVCERVINSLDKLVLQLGNLRLAEGYNCLGM
jgi:hypothetical protein